MCLLLPGIVCAGGLSDRSVAQLHHTSWTVRDGAPTDVQTFAQTDDGFLWLATESGLIRFDGVQFERYAPSSGPSLPAASIRSLLALPGNGLLIGWLFGGATLVQNGKTTTFGAREGYPPGTTYQFLMDRNGTIWAANSAGLARLEGGRWQRSGVEANFTGLRARTLFQDRDGTLGVFTDTSLMVLPPGAMSFRDVGSTILVRTPVARAADGTLYLPYRNGIRALASLAQFPQGGRVLVTNSSTTTGDFLVILDHDGGVWFSSSRGGIGHIAHPEAPDAQPEYFSKPEGLTDSSVLALFTDRNGSVWVATSNGIDQFRLSSFVPPLGPMQAGRPAMLPAPEAGLLFSGIDQEPWLQSVSASGEVRNVASLNVTCAYRDPKGVEWYGSQPRAPASAELIRREGGKIQHIALPPDVPPEFDIQAITMDGDGAVWVSIIRRGLYKLAHGAWTRPAELPDAGKLPALTLTADSLGRVWIGYLADRLARWEQGAVHIYGRSEGLDVGNVLAIHSQGAQLWVGGDHGLALLDSGRLRTLKAVDDTVLRGITGIVMVENGDLWVHGRAGAVRFEAGEIRAALADPTHRMAFRLFDEDDGLYSLPTDIRPLPTLVEGTDGRLWFATHRGVFVVDPAQIITNRIPPNVVLKNLAVGSMSYTSFANVSLPPHSSSLRFDYTATGLVIAQRAHFRYKLDGVDADWQDAGTRRQAFYTNLTPGSYRFRVTAANENGFWNQTGASMEFTILPDWNQSWWFRTGCVIAVLAAILLLFRLRMLQMQRHLQERLQERFLERERIARELHDTLIQGFQGLVLLFGAIRQRIAQEDPVRELMGNALTRANDVLAEGRDRVKGLRDSLGLRHDLPAALQEVAEDLSRAHAVEFSMSVIGTPRELRPGVMAETCQIGREALANAYRHAAATRVQVEVIFSETGLRMRVTDDGVGMDTRILRDGGIPGHFGVQGMHERARKMKGTLHLRSGPGSGTAVELEVPSSNAYRDRKSAWWNLLSSRSRTDDAEYHE